MNHRTTQIPLDIGKTSLSQKINTKELGTLSYHDQLVVDFYNKFADKQTHLGNDLSRGRKYSEERLVIACNILGLGNEFETLKKEAHLDVKRYLNKVNQGFRSQSLSYHPDRLEDKTNAKLEKIANEVIKILGQAKAILLEFPQQFLSNDLHDLAKYLDNASADEIESFVAEPNTQNLLRSIDNLADLMRVLTPLTISTNHKVFWSSSWISTEFFHSLPRFIKTASNLIDVLTLLPTDKKNEFCELPNVMKLKVDALRADNLFVIPGLGSIAPEAYDLFLILNTLPDNKVVTFLNLPEIQEQLPNLIKAKSDVDKILEALPSDACEFLLGLSFVKEIIQNAESEVKSRKTFIELNHPNLLKIQDAINQCLEVEIEINKGTLSNPGYQVRVIFNWESPDFFVIFLALTNCSAEYGISVTQIRTNQNFALIIKTDEQIPLKDDFAIKFKAAYANAIVLKYHDFNLKVLKSLIENEKFVTEVLSTKDGFNILKITGSNQNELAALNEALIELKSMFNTECILKNGTLIINLITEKLITYEFSEAFKKSYHEHLHQTICEKPPQIFEKTMPARQDEALAKEPLTQANDRQPQTTTKNTQEPNNPLGMDDKNESTSNNFFSGPIPQNNIDKTRAIKLRGGIESNETIDLSYLNTKKKFEDLRKINEFKKELQKLIDDKSKFNPFLMPNKVKRIVLRNLLDRIEAAATNPENEKSIAEVIKDWKKEKSKFKSEKKWLGKKKKFLPQIEYRNDELISHHRNIFLDSKGYNRFFNRKNADTREPVKTKTELALNRLIDEYGPVVLRTKPKTNKM